MSIYKRYKHTTTVNSKIVQRVVKQVLVAQGWLQPEYCYYNDKAIRIRRMKWFNRYNSMTPVRTQQYYNQVTDAVRDELAKYDVAFHGEGFIDCEGYPFGEYKAFTIKCWLKGVHA